LKGKLLIATIAIFALGAFVYTRQSKADITSVSAANSIREQQIAEAQTRLNGIKDKGSQEYKEAKEQYCQLTSRPEAERKDAVANVREFLHATYPLWSREFTVDFDCGRGNYEYYQSENWQFIIDPKTNHLVEMGEASRSWDRNIDGSIAWQNQAPEYDYTNLYNAEEAGKVAEKFITDHPQIFGVDVSKMTREYEGTKDGGDGITPGGKVNYFYNWTAKDATGNVTALVRVTITRGGQIVVYDNDTYDMAKN
jgi:hypothetical protein